MRSNLLNGLYHWFHRLVSHCSVIYIFFCLDDLLDLVVIVDVIVIVVATTHCIPLIFPLLHCLFVLLLQFHLIVIDGCYVSSSSLSIVDATRRDGQPMLRSKRDASSVYSCCHEDHAFIASSRNGIDAHHFLVGSQHSSCRWSPTYLG